MHDTYEIGVLQEQVKFRETRIIELERQVAALRDQSTVLESEVCVFRHLFSITRINLLKLRLKEGSTNIYENDAYKEVVLFALKLDADLVEKYKQTADLEEHLARMTMAMDKHDSELMVRFISPWAHPYSDQPRWQPVRDRETDAGTANYASEAGCGERKAKRAT